MLSSFQAFDAALHDGASIDLAAYTLGNGMTEGALLAAAARGAHVRVRLAGTVYGDPTGALALHNRHEAALLAAHGIDAELVDTPPLHLKAAVVDGRAFFDDRNFCNRDDLVVSTNDQADVVATAAVIAGAPAVPAANGLALTKGDALRAEEAVVAAPGDTVELETETLGPSLVMKLLAAAAAHADVHLLFTRHISELHAGVAKMLAKLAASGVAVRSTGQNDKLCIHGALAWAGSANASGGEPSMSDWGVTLDDAASVAALRARFEKTWSRAKLVDPAADT